MGAPISTPRKRPRQQRSKETFEAILEAAAQLFEQYGYADATTNKIAERAGVSIGSLYQYFPNKDALLYALGERHVTELLARFEQVFARLRVTRPPLEETVRILIGTLAELHAADPLTHRLLYDQAPRPPEAARMLREVQAWTASEVEHHLNRLGVDGPDHRLTALLLVQSLEAQVHGAVLEPPARHTTEEVIEAAVTLCLRSLRPVGDSTAGIGD